MPLDKITQRAALGGDGRWVTCFESANSLISDLMQPSTEIARMIASVEHGDLSSKMPLEVEGQLRRA